MLPGSAPNYNTVMDLRSGKSIIAGAGFDTWTFRYGFDVSIPVFTDKATIINSTQPKQKRFLVISSQLNIPNDYLAQLKSIASSSIDLLLLEECEGDVDYTKRCEYSTGTVFNYPDVLKDGVYCLVVRSARLAQASLLELLASQCIPIVIADDIVMPFSSHLDWNRLSIFIPEKDIKKLLNIVHSISDERRTELYWQQRWVYERYFSSIESVVLTTLEILNEKVFPLSARMYEEWNLPQNLVSLSLDDLNDLSA